MNPIAITAIVYTVISTCLFVFVPRKAWRALETNEYVPYPDKNGEWFGIFCWPLWIMTMVLIILVAIPVMMIAGVFYSTHKLWNKLHPEEIHVPYKPKS